MFGNMMRLTWLRRRTADNAKAVKHALSLMPQRSRTSREDDALLPLPSSTLPVELVQKIVKLVQQGLGTSKPQWFRDLALISKNWLPVIRAIIFGHTIISLDNWCLHSSGSLGFFRLRPHLATYVTSLCVIQKIQFVEAAATQLSAFKNARKAEFSEHQCCLDIDVVRKMLASIPWTKDVAIELCRSTQSADSITGSLFHPSFALEVFHITAREDHVTELLTHLLSTPSQQSLQRLSIKCTGSPPREKTYESCLKVALQFGQLRTLQVFIPRLTCVRFPDCPLTSHPYIHTLALTIGVSPTYATPIFRALLASADMPSLRQLKIACWDSTVQQWMLADRTQPIIPHALTAGLGELSIQLDKVSAKPGREDEIMLAALFGVKVDLLQTCFTYNIFHES